MTMKSRTSILILILLLPFIAQAKVVLPPFFSDNMVLQQQTEVKLWGTARANSSVIVKTSWDGAVYKTKSDSDGDWSVVMHTGTYGGPYSITVSDGKRLTLENVLLGDVWICGGQSNMEMRVGENVTNMAEAKATASSYGNVRILHVENNMSIVPTEDVGIRHGGWQECSAETIQDFSAVGYFFGTALNDELDMPVGLIESCWGGTLAEAWTSAASLAGMPYFAPAVEKIETLPAEAEERTALFNKEISGWAEELKNCDPAYSDGPVFWGDVAYDDSSWNGIESPGYVQDADLPGFSGFLWMRKTVDVPASWIGNDLVLDLAVIDDNDFTFFNGVEVGHTEGYWARRTYVVPKELVRPGKNVVSVRVMDTGGKGGFGGDADDMALRCGQESLSLAGIWKYKVGMRLEDVPVMPVNTAYEGNYPSFLYNAMIYPLIKFPIKGAIWYQGEANVERAMQYQTLFPLMINDWRKSWGYDFPFYFCQLANYMAEQTGPEESAWAELREAQARTLSLDNTGMAVLIDIGEADDIHPKNKVDVGRRLALNALAGTYGHDVVFSGPVYKSHKIENSSVRLSFEHASGLNVPDGQFLSGFYIAGVDGVFHKADAVIMGEDVIVRSDEVAFPVAVRYGWANNPKCNLYNGAGLPAAPFRTDIWPSRKNDY